MILLFYFFAAVLILLSLKSLLAGIEYLRFFKTEIVKPPSEFTPFVTVIAPCRGLDAELDKNLQALFNLDYPNYEIVFVVDDKADPAASVINAILAERELTACVPAKLIVAQKSKTSGQKVENLREAVLHTSPDSKAFAFVDSDVRPSSEWLRFLVAPLADENVGAATGYRWFIAKNPSLASELRSAWNASIASALGPNTASNFCWGGSMAIRRDTFERLNIRDKWEGTVSDDFAVTRVMKGAKLPIVFVPQALTASPDNCTFAEMLEFTTRQMKITRVYAPNLWILSLYGSTLFILVIVAALLILIFNREIMPFYSALATVLLVTVCSTVKAWLRLNAAKLVLTDYRRDLEKQFWTQNTLWLFTPAIFLFNSAAAGLSRRIKWRGIVYELKSSSETVIIAD